MAFLTILFCVTIPVSCQKDVIAKPPQPGAAAPAPVATATVVKVSSISELRAVATSDTVTYQLTDSSGSQWQVDTADKVSLDDTATVVVTQAKKVLKRKTDGAINVKWYGAKGDSSVDETDAINKAFKAAALQKKDIYFPAGVYRCNKVDADKHILSFYTGGLDNINIEGDGPTSKITSSTNSPSALLTIFGNQLSTKLTIKNLFFESTHGITTQYIQGIFLQGYRSQLLQDTKIAKCTFEGFTTAIAAIGVKGLEISNNKFNAPKGHDNALNNSSPAVFIWTFDNENGYCSDINILNNVADGFSGASIGETQSKRPMDGFVYGTGYGYVISGNKTKNFSEEHLAIAFPTTFPKTDKTVIITNNDLNCLVPTGSKNQNGSDHLSNYAIRCEAPNTTITNNRITNFTNGIMVRTYDNPGIQTKNYEISGNTLIARQADNGVEITKGISLQGSIKKRLQNARVFNNSITVNNARTGNFFSAIVLYDTDSADINNNQITVNNQTTATRDNNFGISYGRVSKVSDKSNTIKGIKNYHLLNTTDQVNFQH